MEKEKLLLRMAYMYYKQNMDLKEIGEQFNISYATVSRFLKEGRKSGLIEIKINHPIIRLLDLEAKLKNAFNLKDVVSVNTSNIEANYSIKNLVSIEAANYLMDILKDGDMLGISWGSTICQVVNNFSGNKKIKVDVIQLNGNLSNIPIELNSSDLVRRMKDMFTGSYYFINSEAIVDNQETKNLLVENIVLKKTILLFNNINIALIGIGAFNKKSIQDLYINYMKNDEIMELLNKNIVGETCFNFFDSNGNIIDIELNKRTITINKNSLKNINNKIMVASGVEKTEAIIGALKAKIINTLITDSLTLENILKNLAI